MGRVGTPWLELVFPAVRVRHLLSAPYSLRPWGWELYVAPDTDRSPELCWEKDWESQAVSCPCGGAI